MIELQQGAIYKSTSGRVKYDGIDSFCGEQTFRFKRLERIGTDYVLPSEIEKFLCIDSKEKTYEDLVTMNKELLAALESIENDDGKIPDFMWNMIKSAIAKAKGTS